MFTSNVLWLLFELYYVFTFSDFIYESVLKVYNTLKHCDLNNEFKNEKKQTHKNGIIEILKEKIIRRGRKADDEETDEDEE